MKPSGKDIAKQFIQYAPTSFNIEYLTLKHGTVEDLNIRHIAERS